MLALLNIWTSENMMKSVIKNARFIFFLCYVLSYFDGLKNVNELKNKRLYSLLSRLIKIKK